MTVVEYEGMPSEFESSPSVTGLLIDPGVTSIAAAAFYQCSALRTLAAPPAPPGAPGAAGPLASSAVTSISERAFAATGLLDLVGLPPSLSSLSSCAFAACPDLRSLRGLPLRCEVHPDAFYNCTGLQAEAARRGLQDVPHLVRARALRFSLLSALRRARRELKAAKGGAKRRATRAGAGGGLAAAIVGCPGPAIRTIVAFVGWGFERVEPKGGGGEDAPKRGR
ncbi:hypothetical protein TeGR_g3276, partial [Tetraparma gracilis]